MTAPPQCSFCHKDAEKVKVLFQEGNAFICDECIDGLRLGNQTARQDRTMKGWAGIITVTVGMLAVIVTLQEFANSRCSTPFWRGFGIALGACR